MVSKPPQPDRNSYSIAVFLLFFLGTISDECWICCCLQLLCKMPFLPMKNSQSKAGAGSVQPLQCAVAVLSDEMSDTETSATAFLHLLPVSPLSTTCKYPVAHRTIFKVNASCSQGSRPPFFTSVSNSSTSRALETTQGQQARLMGTQNSEPALCGTLLQEVRGQEQRSVPMVILHTNEHTTKLASISWLSTRALSCPLLQPLLQSWSRCSHPHWNESRKQLTGCFSLGRKGKTLPCSTDF